MNRQELAKAIEDKISAEALTDYLLGLPEQELKALAISPIKKHAKKHGFDITAGELGELLKELLEAEKKRPHFERIGNAAIKKLVWIVEGILEAGALGMVFGDSGVFKSFIAIALSACIATGRAFYGSGHGARKTA